MSDCFPAYSSICPILWINQNAVYVPQAVLPFPAHFLQFFFLHIIIHFCQKSCFRSLILYSIAKTFSIMVHLIGSVCVHFPHDFPLLQDYYYIPTSLCSCATLSRLRKGRAYCPLHFFKSLYFLSIQIFKPVQLYKVEESCYDKPAVMSQRNHGKSHE